jgi:hypothetical protein
VPKSGNEEIMGLCYVLGFVLKDLGKNRNDVVFI